MKIFGAFFISKTFKLRRKFVTETNCYQQIIQYLGLLEDEDADAIFQYCINEYPLATDDDCHRMLGMLSLIFPDKDYDKLVTDIFPDDETNPTRKEKFISFMKSLIIK
jgi:hypothetical protein